MNNQPARVLAINTQLLGWFRWFVGGYLKRHFHSLAVNRRHLQGTDIGLQDALVVYANHAAWWDPLTAIHFSHRLFPSHAMYAPIDARALAKYPMFSRMGFFGVEQQQPRGARDFLLMSRAILAQPGASLWLTPEGRFADVRDTTATLMPGLTHLAYRAARPTMAGDPQQFANADTQRQVWFIPFAAEYPFWEERRPELLTWFGRPLSGVALRSYSKPQIARELAVRLRQAQAELAAASVARDAAQFEVLGKGQSGTFFIYDWWRQLRGKLRGERVRLEHGEKLN